MSTGVGPGLQNPWGVRKRLRWVRLPHAPAIAILVGGALLSAAFLPAGAGAQAPDTLLRAGPAEPAEQEASPDTTEGPPVTPLGAFARSLILPGWGQTELDRRTRGAIYFTAEAFLVSMLLKTQLKLSSARSALEEREEVTDADRGLVDSRKDQREDWLVGAVTLALFSGIDAWVSAQLHGFEPELEAPEDGTPGARVTYRVPLRLP